MSNGLLGICSAKALRTYLKRFPPLASEDVSLLEGLEGRVLAQEVHSADTIPTAHRAGVDGFAICTASTAHAKPDAPAFFTCIGDYSIATMPDTPLLEGQCVRLDLGGVLPCGADAVIKAKDVQVIPHTAENTPMSEGHTSLYTIAVTQAVPYMHNVIQRGEDAQVGMPLFPHGTLLRPQEVALLASTGVPEEEVDLNQLVHGAMRHTIHVLAHKRPQVAIISTGDEVVPVYSTIDEGKVRDVNSHALAALIREVGGLSRFHGIVPDSEEKISEVIERALLSSADVIFITGGNSESAHELTLKAIQAIPQRHGIEIFCSGVSISPGSSLILAKMGNKTIWSLPGQVSAVQTIMHVLGQPFLRHLQGIKDAFNQNNPLLWKQCQATLGTALETTFHGEKYIRVRLEFTEHNTVIAYPITGLPGLLHIMTQAQGLVRMSYTGEKNSNRLEEGTEVRVLLFS